MQAYIAIKYHANSGNRGRIERISAALTRLSVSTVCITRDVEQWGRVSLDANTLMQVSFEAIDASDLLIVDLTEKGIGVGIEAGYAYARGLPIITIAEAGADISETLRGISDSVSIYRASDELETVLKEACASVPRLSAQNI